MYVYMDGEAHVRATAAVEEKFRKYFGCLARCDGKLCTTTLKTDWICKNRVHQHKFYGKPRVPKKSSEYDRGSGHFNADEYYLHYEFLPTIM